MSTDWYPRSRDGQLHMVDTGAWTLAINEETRQKLGLWVGETAEATVAGESPVG